MPHLAPSWISSGKDFFALSSDRATLAARLERLTQADADVVSARAETQKWREECQRAEQRLTETATRLHEQRQATADREQMSLPRARGIQRQVQLAGQ